MLTFIGKRFFQVIPTLIGVLGDVLYDASCTGRPNGDDGGTNERGRTVEIARAMASG